MKYIIVLLFPLFIWNNSFAQTVDGQPLDSIDSKYILIMGQSNLIGTKVVVTLDFGQSAKWRDRYKGNNLLLDENGERVIFNTMIDALNFFDTYGFDFVNAYSITVGGSNVYHYLMCRNR
jgi:hypothetical protein